MKESKQAGLFDKKTSKNIDKSIGTYLFFDTETTGLPKNWRAPVEDLDNWPRIVQIAWAIYKDGEKIDGYDFIIKPDNFEIPAESSNIHGITTEHAKKIGIPIQVALSKFESFVVGSEFLVAHNISFDEMVIGAEFLRVNMPNSLVNKKKICTKEISTDFCAIPSTNGKVGFKWPKLSELYIKLFGTEFEDSHNAIADVEATAKCFWEMKNRGI